jgi:hypothetical protein
MQGSGALSSTLGRRSVGKSRSWGIQGFLGTDSSTPIRSTKFPESIRILKTACGRLPPNTSCHFLPAVDLETSRVDHSLRSAWIGLVLAALRAGMSAASSAANARSRVAPAKSSGFHGATPKSWLAMR